MRKITPALFGLAWINSVVIKLASFNLSLFNFASFKALNPAPIISHRNPLRRRRGFTLAEVLAALLLMSIVLPSIMYGISQAGKVADQSRRRTEAAGLAQMEMATLLANQTWQNGNQSGDFNPDFPDYSWQAAAAPWPGDTEGAGLDEIDLTVTWTAGRKKNSVILCSLAYPRGASSTSTTATP